jgi:hypothetical protein
MDGLPGVVEVQVEPRRIRGRNAALYDWRLKPRLPRIPPPDAAPAPAPPRVALEVWHQKSKNPQPFNWKSCTQHTCNFRLILPWNVNCMACHMNWMQSAGSKLIDTPEFCVEILHVGKF